MTMQIRFREGRLEQSEIGTHIIGSEHLANNAVSYATQIKDGIIGYAELTTGLQGSLGGAVPPDSIGTTELKEPAVGSANIYNGAVYGAKIKNNAVGSQQLANAGVISTKIANDAVGSQHMANDAIGSSAMINTGVILGYNLKNNTIGSQQLANSSVISTKIARGAVGSQHLANNAVSYAAQIKDGIIGYAELTTGLQGTYMPVNGGTFIGSVDYSGKGKPPRLAILTPGGGITSPDLGAVGTAIHTTNFSWYELRFHPSSSRYAHWEFQAPKYYDGGTIDITIYWKSHPATGTVVWQVATLGKTTGETWNTTPVAFGPGTVHTNTQGSAKVTQSIISGKPDFLADELAVVRLGRQATIGKDTLAGSASLLMVGIDYRAIK